VTTRAPSLQPSRDEALSPAEVALVDLAQWLARAMQYSLDHASCQAYADRAEASLRRAIAVEPVLSYSVLKDGILMGDVEATHRAVTTRLAPHLHQRGVQGIRLTAAAGAADLRALVELLALRVQSTFDAGGLPALVRERAIRGVEIDEIAHDVDVFEQAAQRQRAHLRAAFGAGLRAVRAGRWLRGLVGEKLLELLDRPEIAVLILEEDPAELADAFAALCLMVRREEARSGRQLYPKLRAILLSLSPPSHARVVVGLPPLVGELRAALVWALEGLSEPELAWLLLTALRANAAEMDLVLYAAVVAAPHEGRRVSTFRWLALRLHDLPATDGNDAELLAALAIPVAEGDPHHRERLALQVEATRVLATRSLLRLAALPPPRRDSPEPLDAQRILGDLVRLAGAEKGFARVCERLPDAASTLADEGADDALLGVLRGLDMVPAGAAEPARRAAAAIARPGIVARLLADLEERSRSLDDAQVAEVGPTARMLVGLAAEEVWEHVERWPNGRLQRVLLDALGGGGPRLLPLVTSKLRSPSWVAIRDAVSLLPRLGAAPKDLVNVAYHPHERVRGEVLRALRAMPMDEVATDLVVDALVDASPEVRSSARVMLRGEALGAQAIAALHALAGDGEQAQELRQRAVEALAQSPRDEAAEALYELVHPKSLLEIGGFREIAAAALRRSRAPRAAALFAEGLRSPVRRVRWACEKAAGGEA
jgi:hypothetical protein